MSGASSGSDHEVHILHPFIEFKDPYRCVLQIFLNTVCKGPKLHMKVNEDITNSFGYKGPKNISGS